ncbi:MAG: hypothetical protein WC458_03420 [Patescibacteria group bacterium]
MKKYLKTHISFVEENLKKKSQVDWKNLSEFNRTQIGFFQHERLIHLLITLFFGLLFFLSVIAELLLTAVGNSLIFLNIGLTAVNAIFLLVLGFYIGHYFILENGVQELYQLDKKIAAKNKI